MVDRTGSYLADILQAIDFIMEDVSGHTFESFRQDRRARQLVERNLEVISEASRRIPEELKGLHPQIAWKEIAGIGNILRHEYHRTYPTLLWSTCETDLEPLRTHVESGHRDARKDRNMPLLALSHFRV